MYNVNIKRKELLKEIKKNRDGHRNLFLKAQKGYRDAVIKELDRMLKEARHGKKIRRAITMPEPQDHTEDYDRVIQMLEMSTDEVINLDAGSFDQYVRDNWAWKVPATATNAMYAARKIK